LIDNDHLAWINLQMMEYVVTLDDINQELMCTVSTTNPVFSTQATTVLHVQGMYNILGIL